MLHRIVYLSASRALLDPPAVEALLAVSRRNNAERGITGLMLYHDGSFLQVIEGPKAQVQALYARIAADPRHCQVIEMVSGPAESRAFPDWQMGFLDVDALDPARREGAVSLMRMAQTGPGQAVDPVVGGLLRSFLRSFRDLQGVGYAS